LILTRAEDLACPSCHAPLELSRLSAAAGLLAAYFAVRFAMRTGVHSSFGWVLPLVEAVFAYAIASILTLVFFSDLIVPPRISSAAFPHSHS
jgi:hypothetical protein